MGRIPEKGAAVEEGGLRLKCCKRPSAASRRSECSGWHALREAARQAAWHEVPLRIRQHHRQAHAGKSTLLNALVGDKIAIVSRKPQTTRNRIQGIVNVKAAKGRPAGQIVFVITPGVHKPDSGLNRKMMHEVQESLQSPRPGALPARRHPQARTPTIASLCKCWSAPAVRRFWCSLKSTWLRNQSCCR